MIVLVAGGTGFLGKRVARLLERQGHQVIVYHRGERAVPTYADVIINCAGIIREQGAQTFPEVHVELTKWLVGLGKKLKVRQFVQVSALGADLEGTPYQRTKAQAERLVISSGLPYAIIRPSMMFGPDDKSINTFRRVARTGFFPLFADGKVQPVSVDTVAQVVVAAAHGRIRNRIAGVGGPEVFTYSELADRLHPGVRSFQLPSPLIRLFTLLGSVFTALPTMDMVRMLQEDNITSDMTAEKLKIRNPRVK